MKLPKKQSSIETAIALKLRNNKNLHI